MAEAELAALPPETLDGHIGILATSGAGKTYGAKTAVEDLLEAGRRVCVIDPTGVWWGLRAEPGGEAGGYPVAIIGGDHADVPLTEGSGAALAQAIAGGAFSAIVDVSRLTVGARTRLFTDFAEELARANRRPLHLVIDEAHLFMPQGRVNDPQSGRMVSAANNLVSGGRALGLRLVLLSQRPAKVHKDSLSQVATLVPMWMMAPQDTTAVKAWIADVADPERGREVLASLPTLQVGQGWVWAPRAGVFSRIAFRPLRTFDSSRAPALDEDAPAVDLSALPIEALRAALAEALHASDRGPSKPPSPTELHVAEQRGYERGLSDGERREWKRWLDAQSARNSALLADITAALDKERGRFEVAQATDSSPSATQPAEADRSARATERSDQKFEAEMPVSVRDLGAKQKVLDSLAWWSAAGIDPVQRYRACVLAGYSPKASTFGVYVAELARDDLLAAPTQGFLTLTEAGRARAVWRDTSLLEAVRALLSPAQARTFDTLRVAGPNGLPRKHLADRLGLSSSASTLGVYLSALTSLGFVETVDRGVVRVVDWLRKEPG